MSLLAVISAIIYKYFPCFGEITKKGKVKKRTKKKNKKVNQAYLPTMFLLPYCLVTAPLGVV